MVQRLILVLTLSVFLAIPDLYAGAQTPAASAIPAEDELVGLQAAVLRSYAPSGTFMGEGILTVDDATPVSSLAGTTQFRDISVIVRRFDTTDHAASAFEQISAGNVASLANVFPDDGTQDITAEDLPGIGSQATLVRSDYTGPGSSVWLEYVTVQRDQYVFFVSATGSIFLDTPGSDDVDTSLPTVAIATAIASEGEPSPEEPVYMDDGTSTGGLWGFMLPANDPLLMGMVPFADIILYPRPSS